MVHWLVGLHIPSPPNQTEPPFTMKRGPSLTIDAIASHDRACSRWRITATPVYFWTMSGIRCGPAGLGENKLVCPGHLTVDKVLGMQNWIRFATDAEKKAERETCGDGEEPLWWRKLEENGVRFQPKAFIIGSGANATVALPHHAVGAKGKHVTVLMHEPEVEAEGKAVDPKLLDGVRTPPTPDPFAPKSESESS